MPSSFFSCWEFIKISSHHLLKCGSISNRSFNFCCDTIKTPHSHVCLWGPLSPSFATLLAALSWRENKSRTLQCFPVQTTEESAAKHIHRYTAHKHQNPEKKTKKNPHFSLQVISINLWLGGIGTNGPQILMLSVWCCAESLRCFV